MLMAFSDSGTSAHSNWIDGLIDELEHKRRIYTLNYRFEPNIHINTASYVRGLPSSSKTQPVLENR